ncbi:MAG TPA: MBL fold metallo-hydrolase [Rubricoccaceae bacterium]|jgi:phosphoribosyl 1,2-cyclic phosphate phosphodiesterase|nr:MBL fold metallo-hydrolase [Rubricoccaceae bacterium]
MIRSLRATLLGTGTSTGVPVVGCRCRVCTSADPRDRRLRCAAYVVAETDAGPVHLVIDTGPDFRQQALRYGVAAVDAVLVTHHHFDHVVGLDDLRPFFFGNHRAIPVYASPTTAAVLRRMFGYIFCDGTYPGISNLDLEEVAAPFEVASRAHGGRVTVTPIPALHGGLPVYGYRVGRFAYLTDVNAVPEESLALLEGLDVLVLDALRREPHPTHFTIGEAVEVARRIGARETHLVHMTHSVLHAETEARLPEGVHLAYDGLVVEAGNGK